MVVAVFLSVVRVYYYLRIVVAMYFHERKDAPAGYASVATGAVLALLAALVLMLGVMPAPVMGLLP